MSLKITELVNYKYTSRENFQCNQHKPTGIGASTLSMSLQCICDVPGPDTGLCPQCEGIQGSERLSEDMADEEQGEIGETLRSRRSFIAACPIRKLHSDHTRSSLSSFGVTYQPGMVEV